MYTLDNAVMRFYTLKGKYPESVYEAIKEGELKGTFNESMAFNNVYYLPGRNKDEYLIYTLTANPESKDYPYLTLSGKNGQASTNKYYSLTDLQNLVNSFGGKIIPPLTVTIGPTIKYSTNPQVLEKIDLQHLSSSCKIEKTCGNLVGVDCGSAVDGPYYYAEKDSGKIVEYCGGYCMSPQGNYCKNCPPKEWTCK